MLYQHLNIERSIVHVANVSEAAASACNLCFSFIDGTASHTNSLADVMYCTNYWRHFATARSLGMVSRLNCPTLDDRLGIPRKTTATAFGLVCGGLCCWRHLLQRNNYHAPPRFTSLSVVCLSTICLSCMQPWYLKPYKLSPLRPSEDRIIVIYTLLTSCSVY